MKEVDGKYTLPGSSHPLTVKFADAKPAELAKFEARGTKRGAWEMGGGGGGGMGMGGMMGDGGGGKRHFQGGLGRGNVVSLTAKHRQADICIYNT